MAIIPKVRYYSTVAGA